MTLIEIMVVLVILGMIAGAVTFSVMHAKNAADIDTARIDINGLRQAVEVYRLRHSGYPESLQQLEGQEIRRIRPDPWGTPYVYVHEGEKFEVFSYGPDRVASQDDVKEDEKR